jgi:Domain of unknown function (DUF5666)
VRVSVFVFLVAGLVAAACGGLGASASSSPAGASSPAASGGSGTTVAGQLVQLSGAKLVVSAQNGQATITFDRSTRFERTDTGSLSDITVGACLIATGANGAPAVTANVVQVSSAVNGACAAGNAGSGGSGQGRFPNGGNGRASNFMAVRGKVTAVSGGSVTVQPASGAEVTMTVPATARVSKTQSTTSKQLAVGQCVAAAGQADSSGTVKARSITITAAGPNGCIFGGFGPRGRATPVATGV